MPAFSRTFRTLEAQPEGRSRLAIFTSVLVLGAWCAWFALAHVSVYATSASARVEVVRATHPVDAPIGGSVISVDAELDRSVKKGDVIVLLDDQAQQLALGEARAKAAGLGPQVEATRAQIEAEERALGDLSGQTSAALDEASARLRETSVARALSQEESSRVDKLRASGSISDVEAIRAQADADRKSALEEAARSDVLKLRRQFQTDHDDRRTRVASLALESAKLMAELETVKATIATLEHDIDRRRVLAPADGRVGEVGQVRVGSVLKEGDHIATIVSSGDLRIVAQYDPAEALGRVRPGQKARVRLEGFAWTEYGEVIARVTDVAREVRDGKARVELEVVSASPRIPMQHGLPATVQIEIERSTPATLVLRAAGKLVSGAPASSGPAAPAGAPAGGG
jgi:membrane fusion protein (multidrug efflux system)